MNWSKTKTIFIICFLLLDIFLGYQMYERQIESQRQISNFNSNNFNQYTKNNNINVSVDYPSTNQKLNFIQGTFTNFDKDKDALKGIKQIANAHSNISFTKSENGQILTATFKTDGQPIKAPQTVTEMQEFLKAFVYKGDEYKHWDSDDKKDSVIHFIQMYKGNPLFSLSVDSGQLYMLNVYTQGDIVTGYQQILMKTNPGQNEVKITMEPKEAIQILGENYLQVSDNADVNDIELGYINLASDIKESRQLPYVLAWYIHVKTNYGNRSFFVTMFGKVYENANGEKGSGAS
jgi:regulatory protein YycI of two-component signal transduction system YycFG